ncbi:thiopeptide-type bacteriocin biosynthesis protein [Spirillospora sp. CA-294931]|uniref:thiopeptide-type bacteriocin biosynthesis protein n=1 Tax=Spirillospora sp. CA-294931 TaxID=3240042 RepID=UPI003D90BD22
MNETPWKQVNIAFPGRDPRDREHQATTHLARVLPAAQTRGLITSWFFVRKGRWRVRYLPAEASCRSQQDDHGVHRTLTRGVDWTCDIYEPETHAFGGTTSMGTAHQLFHADSHYLLGYLGNAPTDRRERSLILCTALMRAAGLDFGEQGDVWARLVEQRGALLRQQPSPTTWASFTDDVQQLLLGNACPDEGTADWLAAFEEAGARLRTLRESGQLTRGIRAITALQIIFHWNRLGIPGPTQAELAQAAKEAVFGTAPDTSRTVLTSVPLPNPRRPSSERRTRHR